MRIELSRKVPHTNQLKLSRFKNEEGSCIIISRILTSGSADQRLANRVES